MDWQPITLRSCSRAEVGFSNRFLSATGGETRILLGDRAYRLRVAAPDDEYRATVVLRCRVGDSALSVYLNESALGSLLADLVPPSSFETLPEDLQLALLSAAVFPLTDTLEKQLHVTFAVERLESLSGAAADGLLWEVMPEPEAAVHSILLAIDTPLPAPVTEWLQGTEQAAAARDCAGLILPVDLQAGRVSLRMSDIESLRFGDIMLMGVSYVSEGRLRVNIGNYFSCLAQIEDDRLIVRTKLERTMEEEAGLSEDENENRDEDEGKDEDEAAAAAPSDAAASASAADAVPSDVAAAASAADAAPSDAAASAATPRKGEQVVAGVSDLPVDVLFVAGRFNVTLEELQNIQPGYVFDLRKDARQEIEIRANGAEIAKGELVEVDGRTGVRIVECK